MRQRAFNHFLASLDDLAGEYGHYTAYELKDAEYIGVYNGSLREAISALREQGYEPHWVAAAKFHPAPHNAVDHYSMRLIPEEHPETNAAIAEEYDPVQCQYHIHLWPAYDGVQVYGHYERRGDLHPVGEESLREAKERAHNHYRNGTWGVYYLRAVSNLDVEDLD